jgi:hypothetical protein
MLYDSNGFKPYIYFFYFSKLIYAPYIYIYIAPTPKSVEYQFFGQFLKFLKLPRQFSPGMSGSRPGQAGHV